MDENHYNFIKRPLQISLKSPRTIRSVLNKIQNFDRPAVRLNTLSVNRPHRLNTPQMPKKQIIQNSNVNPEKNIKKPQSLVDLHFIQPNAKKHQTKSRRTKSFSLGNKVQSDPESINHTHSIHNQNKDKFESIDINRKQRNAVKSLCDLSLNQSYTKPQAKYLSAWANSYPVTQTYKKKLQTSSNNHNRTNRPMTSTCCSVRYRSRLQLNNQLDKLSKQFEHQLPSLPQTPIYNFPIEFKPTVVCKGTQKPPIENSTKNSSHDDKLIFFRNGIIKYLRRKQHVGRQLNAEYAEYQASQKQL